VENGVVQGATISGDGKEIRIEAPVVMSNCGPQRTVDLVGAENLDKGYLKDLEKLTPARGLMIHFTSDVPLLDYDHLLVVGKRRIIAVFQLTTVCPELAPPGTHYLVAGGDPIGPSPLSLEETRKELDLCIQDLKELLPKFESHAEILVTGAYHREWPCMFSIAGQTMSRRTPIENLYAVGDGFYPEPGMTCMMGAVASGIDAAKDASERLK
jgi:phytoene dehydrogenase-like protein